MTPRRQNRDIDTNDLPIIRGSKGKRSTSKQNEIFPNFSQKEFVNNIAHEIRSPLQGVVNFVGTLRNEWRSFTDTEMDERLELLRDSCSSLMTFTNNLLEYSKHATGNLIQDVSSCNLISLIQEIIKDMNIIYYKNGWKINLEYEGELYDYRTNLDISQISKVLRNLIFNAVKYAAKKDIDIYASITSVEAPPNIHTPENILIQIKDYGSGIREKDIESIFELYTQSSNSNHKIEGTGLGLFVCREIIHNHDGKIWAENNKNSSGVSFYFTIPIREEKEYCNQLNDARSYTQEDNKDCCLSRAEGKMVVTKLNDTTNAGIPGSNLYKIDTDALVGRKILFVDDDKLSVLSSKMILESVGLEVEEAYNSDEALSFINNQKFDLIMLDLMLAPIAGDELIIRAKDSINKLTPIIIQSGNDDIDRINKAMTNGAASYIVKPFDKTKMLNEIIKYI